MLRGRPAVSYKHDAKARAWSERIEEEARRAMRIVGAASVRNLALGRGGDVAVEMAFSLPAEVREGPQDPDVDNLAKLALDALVRARMLIDDKHVTRLHVVKQYTHEVDRVGLAIVIDGDGQLALDFGGDAAQAAERAGRHSGLS